jgi:hypothetical protein
MSNEKAPREAGPVDRLFGAKAHEGALHLQIIRPAGGVYGDSNDRFGNEGPTRFVGQTAPGLERGDFSLNRSRSPR